ncbi:MAG: hypothetical protein GC208_10395 [Alphaproteobacteria bacterium]|nr:hypothetical protein [Alphaproteobacteria bacterium]
MPYPTPEQIEGMTSAQLWEAADAVYQERIDAAGPSVLVEEPTELFDLSIKKMMEEAAQENVG